MGGERARDDAGAAPGALPSDAGRGRAGATVRCRLDRHRDWGRISGRLPAAELEVVSSALQQMAEKVPRNPETGVFDPYEYRCADALVQLAGGDGERATVVVHVTARTWLQMATGRVQMGRRPATKSCSAWPVTAGSSGWWRMKAAAPSVSGPAHAAGVARPAHSAARRRLPVPRLRPHPVDGFPPHRPLEQGRVHRFRQSDHPVRLSPSFRPPEGVAHRGKSRGRAHPPPPRRASPRYDAARFATGGRRAAGARHSTAREAVSVGAGA